MKTLKAIAEIILWVLRRLDHRKQQQEDEHAQVERTAAESDPCRWLNDHFPDADGMSDDSTQDTYADEASGHGRDESEQ